MIFHIRRSLKYLVPVRLETHFTPGVHDVLPGLLTLNEQLARTERYDLYGDSAACQKINAVEDGSTDIVGRIEVEDSGRVLEGNYIQASGAFAQ